MVLEILTTSSVLIIGIFCLRRLTKGRISMRLRYALWLLAAVRLLVPVSVGTSAFSVMNLLPEAVRVREQADFTGEENGWRMSVEGGRDSVFAGEPDSDSADGRQAEALSGQSRAQNAVSPMARNGTLGENLRETAEGSQAGAAKEDAGFAAAKFDEFSLSGIWGMIWLSGFLAVGGYMVIMKWRFTRFLYKNRSALQEERLPEAFAARLSRRGMKVYQVKGLPGPCLVGGHIYIGEGPAAQEQKLTHILAHEYCHARHGDGFWAFLRCGLAAVYWFDPFVWAAVLAARQDSELACDEAAVELLGESGRFAYGRTLLALLESGGGRERCPGMTFMMEGGGQNVRERITALARRGRTKRPVLAMVFAVTVLICGCAFTGAERENGNPAKESGAQDMAGAGEDAQGEKDTEAVFDAQSGQMSGEENTGELARVQKEYEDAAKTVKLSEEQIKAQEESARQEADWQAFMETLHYHGVMEGKDDSELSKNREFDIQAYYDWQQGEESKKPEDGWYLLCREDGGMISLYGLYTEAFGFRGLKTRIGTDVNTLDIPWCASYQNGNSENIRVLEAAEDGRPRRFVWKLPTEESGQAEVWQLYEGYRYDTGTIDLKTLTQEECLKWAKEYLTFDIDKEAAKVHVVYDGDMYLGAIDISAYQDWKTEDVQIVPDTVGISLDDAAAEGTAVAGEEGLAVHLVAGLKLEGVEGLYFDGLPLLTIQVVEDEESASGFRMEHPRIDESYVTRALWQERKLAEMRDKNTSVQADDPAGAGRNDLEKPLVDGAQAHHDLEITFSNPCPDFDRISDRYGERTHPVTGEVRTHTGVDMAAPEGADILAAADGTVCMTGFDTVNGNYVVLWHGQSGQMTYYAHCKTIEVEKGQQVAREEKIATVGKTGTAIGSCLHFAVSSDTNWEEPHWEELDE